MIETIVLLTSEPREPILADVLRSFNPNLTILFATNLTELEALAAEARPRARLVGFATSVIVPVGVLDRFGCGAYNFHPGPPTYPGWAPAAFAIYDGAMSFGVTAHRMIKEVDAGPIVGVDCFDILPGTTLPGLEVQAFCQLVRLYGHLAEPLAMQSEPLPELPVNWSGKKSSRRRCAAACDIPIDISPDELRRRVEAFSHPMLEMCPTITLHGFQFRIARQQA